MLFAVGCSSPAAKTPAYGQDEIGQALSRESGEIVSVRDVVITPTPAAARGTPGAGSQVGAAAVVGAITGSPVAIARAVGSVMGEAGGSKLDNKMGEEITVHLKSGRTVTVVQERSSPPLAPGEEIEMVTTGGAGSTQKVRVIRPLEDPSAPIGARRE